MARFVNATHTALADHADNFVRTGQLMTDQRIFVVRRVF
jgi:hypothetical protein